MQPLSARDRQHQEPEPDKETASSSRAQDSKPAELAVHAGGGTEADSLMQHGPHAAVRSIHSVSQQSSDAVDDIPVLSTPQHAPQSDGMQSPTEETDRSANGTGDPGNQSSTWNGTTAPGSHSGGASEEAQHAAVVLEEAADQDVGTADGGEVDMVATSSAMLAFPVPSVEPLSELSTSRPGPQFGSGVVALSLPDDTR